VIVKDSKRGTALDEAALLQVLELHRARPLADLDGLMDVGRACARSADFPVLAAIERWLADHADAAALDAAGCFLQGYWQAAPGGHDAIVARFLDYAEATPPERLTRNLADRLVFVLVHALRRTASPEIARRARAVLARLADPAAQVRLGWGAQRALDALRDGADPAAGDG
jgi:hypothetical protein